jgi:hypothetical protein
MFLRAHLYSLRSRFATTGPIGFGAISFGGLIMIGAVVAVGVCGCQPEASTSSKKSTGKAARPDSSSATDTHCQQLLSSALDMTKPENLGISSREQQVVDSLNNWAGDCGKAADNDAAPSKEGTSEFADRYDLGDVLHIRDCWLTRQLGSVVMREQANDLDRMVGLFELSIRTVALQGSEEPTIPQNRFDIMLVGRGTPEDRAWLFGELLRQAGFDAVIVRPKANGAPSPAAPGAAPRWLVGVLMDKDVYLFDPTLGWPIPSLEDKGTTALVRRPATLAQAAAHDELLRKLDVPQIKYPLRAQDLKSAKAEAICSSRYSERRFKRLESSLSGNRSATVYAALKDAGGRPGLLSRVAAAGNGSWKKEDVSVWEYPDHQTEAARHLDPQAQKVHDERWLAFQGPVDLEFDVKSVRWVVSRGTRVIKGKNRGPGSDEDMGGRIDEGSTEIRFDPRKEIKSRIAQLQGEFPTAIRKYLLVQLEELEPEKELPEEMQKQAQALPPEKRPKGLVKWPVPQRELLINFHAADDAKFWMGVCQLEQNEKESAEETFNAYVRKYTDRVHGKWVVQAAYLRCMTLAQSNRFALAVQAINQLVEAVPATDFRRPTFELLETRWRTVRDAAKPVAADSNAESKASEKPVGAAAKTEAATKTPTKTKPTAADAKSAGKSKSP